MTKEELVRRMAEDANISLAAAKAALDSLTGIIVERASNGMETRLQQFGVFKPKDKPARTGRNPQTGAAMQLEAKTVLQFKASTVANSKL